MGLRDLDAGETRSLLEAVVHQRRRAEVDDLLLVLLASPTAHTWDLVRHLHAEVRVARRVARMTRRLALDTVGPVDRAVSGAIDAQSPGRVLELAQAEIIEADQAAQLHATLAWLARPADTAALLAGEADLHPTTLDVHLSEAAPAGHHGHRGSRGSARTHLPS